MVLTMFAVALLTLPWLKLIGAVLLLWIGVKLLIPEHGGENISASDSLMRGDQDDPDRRPGDEPRQRDRGRRRGAAGA